MKANELMIEDYLYWGKDKIVKVQMIRKYGDNFGIDVVYNNSVNLYFCTDNDDIYFYNIDDLKPIPLTPEILEKNGWEERPTGYVFYTDGKRYDNSLWYIFGCNTFIVNRAEFQIKYVHELQHVLRLCGIVKEIEL